jgi:hypothetical protein
VEEYGGGDDADPTNNVPADAAGTQIHLTLEVKDLNDIIAMYDYRRIVINVVAP